MLREKSQTIKTNLTRGDSDWARDGPTRLQRSHSANTCLVLLSTCFPVRPDLKFGAFCHAQVNEREKATRETLRLYDKAGVAHCNIRFESHEALSMHKSECAFRPTPCRNVGCLEARSPLSTGTCTLQACALPFRRRRSAASPFCFSCSGLLYPGHLVCCSPKLRVAASADLDLPPTNHALPSAPLQVNSLRKMTEHDAVCVFKLARGRSSCFFSQNPRHPSPRLPPQHLSTPACAPPPPPQVPCDQLCGEQIARREMRAHCLGPCLKRPVECPFYAHGCNSPVRRLSPLRRPPDTHAGMRAASHA